MGLEGETGDESGEVEVVVTATGVSAAFIAPSPVAEATGMAGI